ncbi:hypothetical protein ACIA8H_33870 [Streptomyces goshikiensis]|uniref:hypothetical protein n=1 Tax=Streptomyces goshikiensis TaxID=1942 RepID=UPI00378A48FA
MTINDAVRRATQKRITGKEEELSEDASKMAPGWAAHLARLGTDTAWKVGSSSTTVGRLVDATLRSLTTPPSAPSSPPARQGGPGAGGGLAPPARRLPRAGRQPGQECMCKRHDCGGVLPVERCCEHGRAVGPVMEGHPEGGIRCTALAERWARAGSSAPSTHL